MGLGWWRRHACEPSDQDQRKQFEETAHLDGSMVPDGDFVAAGV